MKKHIFLLLALSSLFLLISCEQNNDKTTNFYNKKQRIGLWVNLSTNDSLDFVDDKKLIRKGKIYVYEEYEYKIKENTLYVKSLNFSGETAHRIRVIDMNTITLGNMLITTGFQDSSSTYNKVQK